MAVEMVKLFQLELEHYEKLTGDRLSLEGKANRLAQMIRENFPMAMQGLVVVPLFGGYDERRGEGRLFHYDATGGRWEEDDYQSTGSGTPPAKNSLKKRWKPGLIARRRHPGRRGEPCWTPPRTTSPPAGRTRAATSIPIVLTVTADGAHESGRVRDRRRRGRRSSRSVPRCRSCRTSRPSR